MKRVCKKCGKELPIEEFGLNPMSKDGHILTCKRCKSKNPPPEFLHCPVCNRDLPYYEFETAPKGHFGRTWICKTCAEGKSYRELRNLRRISDKEFRDHINATKRESRKKHFIHSMWKAAKFRADKKGIPFSIVEDDIIIPEKCPILEVPLVFGTKDNYEYTPSIDRIDNNKGYIKGNVMIISKKANSMKNSASQQELQLFCKNILRYSLNYGEQESVEQENKESLG